MTAFKPTCKEVHRLVSEGLDRDLSLTERARMHAHLLICRACRNFDSQMALLRRAVRSMEIPDLPPGVRPDEAQE